MCRIRLQSVAAAAVIAGAVTLGGALLPATSGTGSDPGAPTGSIAALAADDVDAQIGALRERVDQQPQDGRSWAVLALLLIEKGRASADPTWYAQADAAIASSLDRQRHGNDLALAARAALFSAQHKFTLALQTARAALRLDPLSVPALGVRVDALTELGRLASARRAAQDFDQVQPSLAATTRLAYQAELRGDDTLARHYFADARSDATEETTKAFVDFHIGDLARRAGDFKAAARNFRSALQALPGDPAATGGLARILDLQGDPKRAITLLESLVARVPLPEHLISLGELLLLSGDGAGAQEQFAVVQAAADVARANGVRPDLEMAWFEADHGSPRRALVLARSEWHKRQPPMVADALAWALHVNGRDGAALHYARLATSYGGDARSWHHRGAIEAALGKGRAARAHLRRALAVDVGYAPWQALQVRSTLRSLKGQP